MSDEVQVLRVSDSKTVTLRVRDFADSEIDTEELLQVDYNNILGDVITFPVLFNRISNIKAEIDDFYDEVKLQLDILEAQKYEEFRKSLAYEREVITSTGKETGVMKHYDPTEGMISAAITKDPEVMKKKREVLQVKKHSKIVDGLYWSAKSKDKKLDKISEKLTPEDFEDKLLEGSINSVMIKTHKNAIQ